MAEPIRVLLVEDSVEDAELLMRELHRGGRAPDALRVDTEEGLRAAMRSGRWDVAVVDWILPGFSGPGAIEVLKREAFEGPIIVVSGDMGEDLVVEAMRSGADDYVVKDNLRRLSAAIERETAIRRAARWVEGRLAVSEAQLRSLLDSISAATYVAVASDSRTGYDTEYVSPQITQMIGYSPEELGREPDLWYEILHPDDRASALQADAAHFASGAPLRQEYRIFARDGRVVWIRDEAAMLPGQEEHPSRSHGILFDISESKATEETLRRNIDLLRTSDRERRQLVSRLVTAREEEAQRIASEIHDDPIQKLSAAALRLGMLRRGVDDERRSEMIDQVQRDVDGAMSRLRRLLIELSPRTLETGGLGEALREYIQHANQEETTLYRLQDELRTDLDQETRIVAYRVVLDALSNVRKHAAAEHATVRLADVDGGLLCSVSDDGKGIAREDLTASLPGHLGIAAMRQRVEMAGGRIEINSVPGQGTTVEFWLPGD
jgi:two-component system, NarL family, sensor histidine kinase UhpB